MYVPGTYCFPLASPPSVQWQGCSRGGGLLLGVLVTTGLIVPWMLACYLLLRPLSSSASQNSSYKTSRFFSINNSSLKNQDTKSFVPTYSHELTRPLFSTNVFISPSSFKILLPDQPFSFLTSKKKKGQKVEKLSGVCLTLPATPRRNLPSLTLPSYALLRNYEVTEKPKLLD